MENEFNKKRCLIDWIILTILGFAVNLLHTGYLNAESYSLVIDKGILITYAILSLLIFSVCLISNLKNK